ncbi:MAG: DUF5115 domain-containing protein [Bacteroidaceae bacterium]|nr:DUF5115 domain-containing protein [Bacteroidaceae bacterium]
MFKKFLYGCAIAALTTACSEDFDDWASPQSNPQEEMQTFAYAGDIEMANDNIVIADAADVIPLFTYSLDLPTGYEFDSISVDVVDGESTTQYALPVTSENGTVSTTKDELAAIVEGIYGKRPVAREVIGVATVYVYSSAAHTKRMRAVQDITFTVTPEAPVISEAYYIIGTPQGWNNSAEGAIAMRLGHSGSDVYEDPVFTLTFAAPVDAEGNRVDNWFSLLAGNDVEAFVAGDWDVLIGNTEKNGSEALSGKLQSRKDFGGDNNFLTSASDGALYYTVSFNMMDLTYTITPISFADYFYEIGNESGRSTSHALYGPDNNGSYQGYYYLNGEFKFKPHEGDWDGDYEYDGEGRIADNGGSNCPDPGAGFYQIDVNLAEGTYALTKVESITVVGNFNGWNQADQTTHMTYNVEGGYWEATLNLDSDGFKFAMNDDWSVSWGGANGDAAAYDNLSQNGGKDLNIPAEGAGTYNIKLYLAYEGGNKVVLTKQ